MTLLGPCPCATCGSIVSVVRRPVVITGHTPSCRCAHGSAGCVRAESREMTETVTIGPSGDHICRRD